MSFHELSPALRALSRADKLRALQLLAAELAAEEGILSPFAPEAAETQPDADRPQAPGTAVEPAAAQAVSRPPDSPEGPAVDAPEGLKRIVLYTDGACSGNPGPGGYAAILMFGGVRRELTGGFRRTTNNRMELLAVLAGLEALKERCSVLVHSDSRYVVDAVEQRWVHRWQAEGWCTGRERRPVANADLWEGLLRLLEKHEVRLVWVAGHAGDPENEAADRLAVRASRQQDLPPDAGYEEARTPADASERSAPEPEVPVSGSFLGGVPLVPLASARVTRPPAAEPDPVPAVGSPDPEPAVPSAQRAAEPRPVQAPPSASSLPPPSSSSNVEIQLEGQAYTWTGKAWLDRNFLTPPAVVASQLNAELTRRLASADQALTDLDALRQQATAAMEAQQFQRAERLIRRALELRPGSPGVLAQLCSLRRKQGRAQQALAETEGHRGTSSALLTSRAAALCDLGRWEEARAEVGRALAMQGAGSEEAFSVVQRIKKERPDLYEEP